MPNNTVKSFAEKTGKSEAEVEKLWNEAKDAAKEAGFSEEKDPDKFFAYTTGILKKMLKIGNTNESFIDIFNRMTEGHSATYHGIYVDGTVLDVNIEKAEFTNLMKIEFSGSKTLTGLKSVESLKSEYQESDWGKLEKYWENLAKKKSVEIDKLVKKFEKDLNSIIVSMEKDLSKF